MQANSSTTTTTTTTKTKKLSSGPGGNMISSVAVTSATKTTTTTRKPAGSVSGTGASPKSPKAPGSVTAATANSDSNAEIEELSKKITETADAIYNTWKSRGIPPAELIGELTNIASPSTDTEGLQKMVTSFVNKDKEQRGKTNSLKKSEITSNGKVKKAATSTSSAANYSSVPEAALQSPKKVAAVSVSKPVPDVNLNYDINLHLDVNNLSQQQTQNLLKISELIQQQKDVAATSGKKRQSTKSSGNSNASKVTTAAAEQQAGKKTEQGQQQERERDAFC